VFRKKLSEGLSVRAAELAPHELFVAGVNRLLAERGRVKSTLSADRSKSRSSSLQL
jgi:hypothetical protein